VRFGHHLLALFHWFTQPKRTWKNWLPPEGHRERWVHVSVCKECDYVRHLLTPTTGTQYQVLVPPGACETSDICPRCAAYEAATNLDNTINKLCVFTKARWQQTSPWYATLAGEWQLYPENELAQLALVAEEGK
jgi:hypothetical protein